MRSGAYFVLEPPNARPEGPAVVPGAPSTAGRPITLQHVNVRDLRLRLGFQIPVVVQDASTRRMRVEPRPSVSNQRPLRRREAASAPRRLLNRRHRTTPRSHPPAAMRCGRCAARRPCVDASQTVSLPARSARTRKAVPATAMRCSAHGPSRVGSEPAPPWCRRQPVTSPRTMGHMCRPLVAAISCCQTPGGARGDCWSPPRNSRQPRELGASDDTTAPGAELRAPNLPPSLAR